MLALGDGLSSEGTGGGKDKQHENIGDGAEGFFHVLIFTVTPVKGRHGSKKSTPMETNKILF